MIYVLVMFGDFFKSARCIFVHKNISHNPPKSGFGDFENLKGSEFIDWFERGGDICNWQLAMHSFR